MSHATQLSLFFACLDFPGRDVVTVVEIAGKLNVSRQHILEHIEAGALVAVDTKIVTSRSNQRVPIDEYRRWVLKRLTGPAQKQFLRELPIDLVRQIRAEADAILGEETESFSGAAPTKSQTAVSAPRG